MWLERNSTSAGILTMMLSHLILVRILMYAFAKTFIFSRLKPNIINEWFGTLVISQEPYLSLFFNFMHVYEVSPGHLVFVCNFLYSSVVLEMIRESWGTFSAT